MLSRVSICVQREPHPLPARAGAPELSSGSVGTWTMARVSVSRRGRSVLTLGSFLRGRIETLCYPRANFCQGGKDTEERERTSVHDRCVIHSDLEGSIGPGLEGHVDSEVAPQHGRRPGGLDGRDSIDASLDRDPGHEPPEGTGHQVAGRCAA